MQIIALWVVDEALLEQGSIAYPHFVPEYPRTRIGRAVSSIAAEYTAFMDEGAFEPSVPAARMQFWPRCRLQRTVGDRSVVSLAQCNGLPVGDGGRQPRPSDLVQVEVAARSVRELVDQKDLRGVCGLIWVEIGRGA